MSDAISKAIDALNIALGRDGVFNPPELDFMWEAIAALKLEQARQDEIYEKAATYLTRAASDVSDWGAYASPYFRNKHDLNFDVKLHAERAAEFKAMISTAKEQGE